MDEYVALVATNVRGDSSSCWPCVPLDLVYLNSGGALHNIWKAVSTQASSRCPFC
jgi:hypothetical protein